ncbi:hypothetical protein VPDG_00106 [Vibrio phage henriette 12B8]|uniref:hypothetical protein n=1 Tax=Vibrio phage henriette 12B8 TaxID=573174 RepID=UPI0002C0AD93|nr:hypothetical protein VPDG_00106 [Vibrio phage henriette 12B8]AGG58267.1 hypothetical protein VPDG_00106 [Vibrio phage henriette 12B8]
MNVNVFGRCVFSGVVSSIVISLFYNLIWYYALLGYCTIGWVMYIIGGLWELWDKKQNPWKSYHEGTIFDWWPVTIPIYTIAWFLPLYVWVEHIIKKK